MPRHRFRSRDVLPALGAALALFASAADARAQACCAGSNTVTPGRLAVHENGLVGVQVKAGAMLGSYDSTGHYAATPSGTSETDLEQDVFAAVRVARRGQLALLVPLLETRRASGGLSEFGGGVGDVNLSGRYDFTLAGDSEVWPGVAVLAGLTAPTGRPPDSPDLGPLATGATGIGAWQGNVGLALEQAYGPWLVGVSAVVAQRTARTVGSGAGAVHERLAAAWTFLGSAAYVLEGGAAIAGSAAYTVEGDATINGVDTVGTAHRLPTLALSGVLPLAEWWRLHGSIYDNLPLSGLGANQPADLGLSVTLVRSWM